MRKVLVLKWAALIVSLGLMISNPRHSVASSFDYLYIEAAEGNASGGHVAVRFDETVFHFQQVESGLLRLQRIPFDDFAFQYADRENRPIHAQSLQLSDQTHQVLKRAFERRLLWQNSHFRQLRHYEQDQRLAQALFELRTDPEHPVKNWPMPGLGYFIAADQPFQPSNPEHSKDATSPTLHRLKQTLAQRLGDDFLRQKRSLVWQRLLALKPDLNERQPRLVADRLADEPQTFAQRYRQYLAQWVALEVLQRESPVRHDALRSSIDGQFVIGEDMTSRLLAFKAKSIADCLQLLSSDRPDWGEALLVTMARLQAIDLSLDSRYWFFLDRSVMAERGAIDEEEDESARYWASRLQRAFAEELTAWQQSDVDERRYARLEVSANRWLAWSTPLQPAQQLNRLQLSSTPSLSAPVVLIDVTMTDQQLEHYRERSEQTLTHYRQQLTTEYAYDLWARNCVSEIFRMLHKPMIESELRLPASESLAEHIPFWSHRALNEPLQTSFAYTLRPYRERRLEDLYATEADWLVSLRESNVLTSTLYQWRDLDGAFLFFTQDQVWPRPIQGSLNLIVAAGEGLLGLVLLPWDEGYHLNKGLSGVVVSLPELLFFNIRKGSFPQAMPE